MQKYSSYIISNSERYHFILIEMYTLLAAAKTREEYDIVFASVMKKWKSEFTNPDIMQYLIETGDLEQAVYEEIQQWYKNHAEPFQKALLDAPLQNGDKYTLVYMDAFGFPVAEHIIFMEIMPCQYAQYTDAVLIQYRQKRRHNQVAKYFYDRKLAIYSGWKELPREVTHVKISEIAERPKYNAFDNRFFTDCIRYFDNPIVCFMPASVFEKQFDKTCNEQTLAGRNQVGK